VFLLGILLVTILFISGIPLWIGLTAGGAFVLFYSMGQGADIVSLHFFGSLDSFTLMALPFFLIAGNVMAHCGSSRYIYDVINSFVGRMRGGLPVTLVFMCMLYGAITGSSAATLAAVSEIALPEMLKKGYKRKHIAGLMGTSCTLGQLIPPSVYMIVYGSLVQENVAYLFAAGLIPGIICGLALCLVAALLSPKKEELIRIQKENGIEEIDNPITYTWSYRRSSMLRGMPALLMPIVILGGIYSGIFTPTEAGAVAAFYGVLISIFVYRTFSLSTLKKVISGSAYTNSMVFVLVAGSMVFALATTFERIPQQISEIIAVSGLTGNGLLLAVVVIFCILGCFLEPLPILFLVVPILLPTLQQAGINLIHFCIITIVSAQISQLTPPFGLILYVTSGVTKVPIGEVLREALPYMLVLVVILFMVIFVPEISLFLPNLIK